mgnify:CR=1 FL=1
MGNVKCLTTEKVTEYLIYHYREKLNVEGGGDYAEINS